jgi:hypothetical protein
LKRSTPLAITLLMLALTAGSMGPASMAAPPAKPPVVAVSHSDHEVVEGEVVRVVARIPAAATAKRVTLERLALPIYEGIGRPSWEAVESVSVRRRSRVTFRSTAQQRDFEKLRVRVQYKGIDRVRSSKPVKIKVWSWVPLREVQSYYATTGTVFGESAIAGRSYPTWGAAYWSSAPSWESRHTPGRNCKAFRGKAGVTDLSADSSTANIQLFADEQLVWTSPTLPPGMALPFEVTLSSPYRIALLASNTSTAGTRAFPAIGEPELLCSGL